MIPAFANHLWQSSLFGAAAFLLTLTLRHNRAQLRYRLWLAASVKFLIPFSLLLAVGTEFAPSTALPIAPPLSPDVLQIGQPFAPHPFAPGAPAEWPVLPAVLFSLWLSVAAAVAARWRARWNRVRIAIRGASRLAIQAPVPVMSSAAGIEPGIFGLFRPVLLLPEGIAGRLTPAQFRAILAHEFCHVRRRDNLAAALHMLVEALFWFHPLVWWIGARMVEERERACDEEVLRLGSDPEVYAAGILAVCRFYLESPMPCAAGVTGGDLKKRIQTIMDATILHRLTPAKKLLLAATGIAAIATPIAIGVAQAQAVPLRFEVASIKPAKAGGTRGSLDVLPGGGLRMDGVTLRNLIAFAYDVHEEYISGGPKWAGSDTYNLLAKLERPGAADNPQTIVAPGTTAWDRLRLRLQALLAERFQLVVNKDAKQAPGYALVTGKGGSKLTASTSQVPAGTNRSLGRIDGRNGTMHMLAAVLSGYLGRPVVDRTGLTEAYTYKLEYAQDAADGAPSDSAGPSVFTALQEQLGLKLEPGRVATETIVIEAARKPSAN